MEIVVALNKGTFVPHCRLWRGIVSEQLRRSTRPSPCLSRLSLLFLLGGPRL